MARFDALMGKLMANPRDRAAQRAVYDAAGELAKKESSPQAVWALRPDALKAAEASLNAERKEMEMLRGQVGRLVGMSQEKDPLAILEASRGAGKLPMVLEDPSLGESIQGIFARLGEALRTGRFKDDAAAFEAQGYLAFHEKNWESARGYWERAIAAGGDKEVLGALVKKAEDRQNFEDREEKIFISLTRGKSYFNAGQYEKAEKAFAQIMGLDPAHAEARKLLDSSRIMLAEVEKDRLLMENLTLGIGLKKRGKYLEASNHLLKALQLDPGNEEAQRNLQEMMSVIERGSGNPVKQPLSGKTDPEKIRSSSSVDIQKAENNYITGLRHYMGGERKKAKEEWLAALAANPQHKKAQAALNQLLEEEKFSGE